MERMSRVADPEPESQHVYTFCLLHHFIFVYPKAPELARRKRGGRREQFLSDEKWVLTLTAARSESLTCAIQDGFAAAGNLWATGSFAGLMKMDPWVA